MCLSSFPRAWDCQTEGQQTPRCWAVRRWKTLLFPCPQRFWHPTKLMWYQKSLQPQSPCWAWASRLLFQKPRNWRKVQMRDTQRTSASVKHQEAGTPPTSVGHHGLVATVDQGSSHSCDSVVTQPSCLQDLHFLAAPSHPQLPGDVVSRCLAKQLQGALLDFNSCRTTRSLSPVFITPEKYLKPNFLSPRYYRGIAPPLENIFLYIIIVCSGWYLPLSF